MDNTDLEEINKIPDSRLVLTPIASPLSSVSNRCANLTNFNPNVLTHGIESAVPLNVDITGELKYLSPTTGEAVNKLELLAETKRGNFPGWMVSFACGSPRSEGNMDANVDNGMYPEDWLSLNATTFEGEDRMIDTNKTCKSWGRGRCMCLLPGVRLGEKSNDRLSLGWKIKEINFRTISMSHDLSVNVELLKLEDEDDKAGVNLSQNVGCRQIYRLKK